jgi:hypothetical protein
VILGSLRLGVARKREQIDGRPIGSLRYFDKVRIELNPAKPDDDERASYVAMLGRRLGHFPLLPEDLVPAPRVISERAGVQGTPPRTRPQVARQSGPAIAAPVDHGERHDAREGEHHTEGPGPAQGGRAEHAREVRLLEPGGDRRAEQEDFDRPAAPPPRRP